MISRSSHIRIKQLLKCILLSLFLPFTGLAQTTTDTIIEELVVDSTTFNINNQQPETGETEDTEDYEEETNTELLRLPDTIIFRSVPDTTLARLKARKEFEYANDPEYWIKKQEKQSTSKGFGYFLEWLFSSAVVRAIMYMLLAAIIIYTIYRIIVNNNLFYNASRKSIVNTEDDANEMEDENLDEKIAQAIAAKDHRRAVRYLYFKSLKLLDQKGWIRYHAQATNYDYISQVSRYPVSGDFGFLTQVYEYVWYGGFELTHEQFGIVHTNFQKMFKATA